MLEAHFVFKPLIVKLANTLYSEVVSFPTSGGNLPTGIPKTGVESPSTSRSGVCCLCGDGSRRGGSMLTGMLKLLDADVPWLLLECSEGSLVLLLAEFA
ncbi:hypothetical protein L1987_18617 [Smallanthus sonchifolius]|uniref:Uncharacterized protein n=1 Tax=Smallanthus sonchifolius TaxID=185202 RepID=A0ACB9J3R2_9ASTR|nr:hypothetical protein L1987_18617 [Smallanthus sonchifolius]